MKFGALAFDLSSKSVTLWDQGENLFSLTNQKDLGDAVVGILAHPQETANKYLYVASVTTSQKEILESLEKQGGSQWSKTYVETEPTVASAKEKAGSGDMGAIFALVQASAFGNVPGIRANYELEEQLANDLLGLRSTNVEETIKNVLAISS